MQRHFDSTGYSSNQYNSQFSSQASQSRFQNLYEDAERKQKKNQQLLEEKQRLADTFVDPECTFHPKIKPYSTNGIEVVKEKQQTFFDKNTQWRKEVQDKVTQKYKDTHDKDLDECTFHPQIDTDWKVTYEDKNLQPQNPKGIPEFLKRQVLARQMKEHKEYLLENPNRKNLLIPQSGSAISQYNSTTQQSPNSSLSTSVKTTVTKYQAQYNKPTSTSFEEISSKQHQQNMNNNQPIVKNTKNFQKALNQLHQALHDIDI